jgi:hypothetical protein
MKYDVVTTPYIAVNFIKVVLDKSLAHYYPFVRVFTKMHYC